ncbi:MAG: hypothetical protein KTR31_40795 [Myxococcales bacterium]|nr:hypothetical protein [Myxococcales bacterium]
MSWTGPQPWDLCREAASDVLHEPSPHLLASLVSLAYMTSTLLSPLLLLPWMGHASLQLLVWTEDELLWGAGQLLLLSMLPSVLMSLGAAPISNALLRVQARWIRHREPPTFLGTIRYSGRGLLAFSIVFLPISMMQGLGLLLGVVPGIVCDAMFGFAPVAVVLHGVGPISALRLSVRHFLHYPLWRLGLAALIVAGWGVGGVLVLPLLILPALHANVMVRAYIDCIGAEVGPGSG